MVITPAVVIRPTLSADGIRNQSAPSAPEVIDPSADWLAFGTA